MSNYRLIAFDMDGTLLNTEKQMTADTVAAIGEAVAAGKIVVLSTGRGMAELEEFKELLPGIRYVICTSGAIVYDWQEERAVYSRKLSVEEVYKILEVSKLEKTMVQFLTLESTIEKDKIAQMDRFFLEAYRPMYERITRKVDNIYDYYEENPVGIEKINVYHLDPESRERTRARLQDLQIEKVDSEITSLECSALGVTKGEALCRLCEILGIPLEGTIAVGDADNDLAVLQKAGFAIAMGNANDHVKEVCDVVVADCDHDGCAEAIRTYLL